MRYNDNHQRDFHDPDCNEAGAYDDRKDEMTPDMNEQDAFNSPEDRVAHL